MIPRLSIASCLLVWLFFAAVIVIVVVVIAIVVVIAAAAIIVVVVVIAALIAVAPFRGGVRVPRGRGGGHDPVGGVFGSTTASTEPKT